MCVESKITIAREEEYDLNMDFLRKEKQKRQMCLKSEKLQI